jgi:hypothetical protein
MWSRSCEHEAAVRRLALEGGDDRALRAHIVGCEECRDTYDITEAMCRLAAAPLPPSAKATPSASYLWWKAELLRRWDDEQRAVEPVDVGERIGVGLGLVGAVLLLYWVWQRVDIALPALFSISDSGLTVSWVMAATLVFCVVVLGVTAVAIFDLVEHDRNS